MAEQNLNTEPSNITKPVLCITPNIRNINNHKLKTNIMIRRNFNMETILDFGKHKNKTIKELFDADENSYLMWIYDTFDADFSKEIEQELECRMGESSDLSRSIIWGDY